MTDDLAWMSSAQVCAHLGISLRTLDRRRKKEVNPFPEPDYSDVGAENKWYRYKVIEWQHQETLLKRTAAPSLSNAARDLRGRIVNRE
ncbi:excisionase Xis [Budvicia aquatica]|uniref:Excisionase n=2 Tax=Budvicia aquatica TaxID=82979 RepID=A0A2C6DQJ6_9GAMM|nr:excisionase Xis [Budvicia aquatica]PHI31074.1 excisionase [Budvicia aquatica]